MLRLIGFIVACILAYNFASVMHGWTNNGLAGFVSGLVGLYVMGRLFGFIGAIIDLAISEAGENRRYRRYVDETRRQYQRYYGTSDDAINSIKAGIEAKGRGEKYVPPAQPRSVEEEKAALQERIKGSRPLPPPE